MRTDSPHIAGPYGQKTSQSDAHATTQQCSIHFGSSFSLHASPIMAAAAAAAAALATGVINSSQDARYRPMSRQMPFKYFFSIFRTPPRIVSRCLGSRVVSVVDSGAEGPGFKSKSRRCRITVLGKLFAPIVPLFTKQRNW